MKIFKNIIFDLGGIFIDINYPKTEQAFIELGVKNFSDLYNQHHANPLFENLETGKITPDEFYKEFRKATIATLTNEQIIKAWNAMLGNFAHEKLGWLQKIKSQYNIYLFSNTNLIHYNCFQQIFSSTTSYKNFDDFFIHAYYSHSLGMRKPYPESYIQILEKENLVAAETLFIDDTPKNIEGARQAGLQTILLIPPATVIDLNF